MTTPERILVRAPNWIGDQVLAYPFFHYLRTTYPKAFIGVSCVPWVQSVQFRNLVDQVFVLPKTEKHGFISRWRNFEQSAEVLRKNGPWDLGIILPNSFSSAWIFYRAGVKVRRGFSMDGRRLLLNQPLKRDQLRSFHRSETFVRLLPGEYDDSLRPVLDFWGVPSKNRDEPDVLGVVDFFDASNAWTESDCLEPPKEPYWILAPGTTAESRRWSAKEFVQLAKQVSQTTGWSGIIIGGAAEVEVAEQIANDSSVKFLDWTNRGSASSYWKVFRDARFAVCNDSGLAHIASLSGCPVWVIWGAGNPAHTKPIGPGRVHLILNPVDCWPCERNYCNQPPPLKLSCLKGIRSEAVWKEIQTEIRP